MLNCKQPALPRTASTSDPATSVHRALELQSLPLVFQPNNKLHRDRLLQWANETWTTDFFKPISAGNPPVYHDCCCAFSRRAFAKQAGHPDLQSSAVTRIPAFKEVQNAQELYAWLLKTLQKNAKQGHHCFFPRFNVHHSDDVGLDDQDPCAVICELRRRLRELQAIAKHQEATIGKLQRDNDNVLHSMKHWYGRYQELKEEVEKQPPTLFNTPAKRSATSNLVFLENEY